jgi:hypothetical protein
MLNPTIVAQCLAEAAAVHPGWPVIDQDMPVIVSGTPPGDVDKSKRKIDFKEKKFGN